MKIRLEAIIGVDIELDDNVAVPKQWLDSDFDVETIQPIPKRIYQEAAFSIATSRGCWIQNMKIVNITEK